MRRNFLFFLVIILAVVTNVMLIGVLIQSSDDNGSGNVNNGSPEITVKVVSSSSGFPATTIVDASNPSMVLSNERLIITSVRENLTAPSFQVFVTNNASVQITINNISVNTYPVKLENETIVLPVRSSVEMLFTFSEALSFGRTYEIRILSVEGYSATYYKTIC
jgi:hypothetical protein